MAKQQHWARELDELCDLLVELALTQAAGDGESNNDADYENDANGDIRALLDRPAAGDLDR